MGGPFFVVLLVRLGDPVIVFKPEPYSYRAVFALSTIWTAAIILVTIAMIWIVLNQSGFSTSALSFSAFASLPAILNFWLWWRAWRRRGLQSIGIAARPLWVLGAGVLLLMAIDAWQMLSQLQSVRRALGNEPEPAMYTCNMSENEIAEPAILAQWRGVRIFKNPKVGTQFLFADGHTIDTRWFNAETGSFGGSGGFRWTDKGGVEKAAVLSYSDIVSERGTYEIWAEIGNWKGLPEYLNDDIDVSNWAEISLYCTLDGE